MLQKLIFTALVIAVVFYGFRWFRQIQHRDAQHMRKSGTGPDSTGTGGSSHKGAGGDDIEAMVECAVCGSYVPVVNARSCGREKCPCPLTEKQHRK